MNKRSMRQISEYRVMPAFELISCKRPTSEERKKLLRTQIRAAFKHHKNDPVHNPFMNKPAAVAGASQGELTAQTVPH